jgi:hypothetical protein
MTEFLINWNANQTTTRNFNWSIDAFDFANAVNTAMLSNISAWIHYAAKRYYGMMGDNSIWYHKRCHYQARLYFIAFCQVCYRIYTRGARTEG